MNITLKAHVVGKAIATRSRAAEVVYDVEAPGRKRYPITAEGWGKLYLFVVVSGFVIVTFGTIIRLWWFG